ncbi:MAG TPA: prolyl oligopeptidase family serine peptidase [Anaerolineaceae bacterium]|nr:prolyl oligopeptidase family serine peptidase [Anaerolineaceae bacterium]
MFRIESLLSARLFIAPQVIGKRIFFISNLSGHNSLYVMDYGGSVPEPLLPPDIALQNPHLLESLSYRVFPQIEKILVMIDRDGDENYQPMLVPMEGGYPEPAFAGYFANYRVHFTDADIEKGIVYLDAESREEALHEAYQGNLQTGELLKLGASPWGVYPAGATQDHSKGILIDSYTVGDNVMYAWEKGKTENQLLFGVPLEQRTDRYAEPLNAISWGSYVNDDRELIVMTALFEDTYGLAWMPVENPEQIAPVPVLGTVHQGNGEMVSCERTSGDRYLLGYNIDGSSWYYEAVFDAAQHQMCCEHVICGQGELSNGVVESIYYDKPEDRYVLSFSTATTPTQIYTIEGKDRRAVTRHTREKVLGIDPACLSQGEDASFISYDGLRVSARLYLPAEALGFQGPRPLVYYVHGGPQGQERPDFAWFSMPLIEFLTLNGFAVFVPNVRGSTGYGIRYTKHVDRDWGGQDRLDHVHALRALAKDPRVDVKRAGVVGRSYGGYMTLTLATRHPELWSAAVDMFGPFDLITFLERIPVTWKPYFKVALGDLETDRSFLIERSPKTYIDQIACPLLVIQGKNDPRVVERESHDLVDHLRSQGKPIDYLMFDNEGHDVLKYENKVRCYAEITEFFSRTLKP